MPHQVKLQKTTAVAVAAAAAARTPSVPAAVLPDCLVIRGCGYLLPNQTSHWPAIAVVLMPFLSHHNQ